MEWKVYLKKKGKIYRAFKIRQGSNLDITFIPKESAYLSQDFLSGYSIGDQLELYVNDKLIKVDHYSAHSSSGQRHIKCTSESYAIDPFHGLPFKELQKPIPLVTFIAVITTSTEESPSNGKWFGFVLPDDINYCIFDLIAIPKDSGLQFNSFFQINNTKESREIFDHKVIQSRNCDIVIFVRASNHSESHLSSNILFQQHGGKSVIITRIEDNYVLAQIADVEIGQFNMFTT